MKSDSFEVLVEASIADLFAKLGTDIKYNAKMAGTGFLSKFSNRATGALSRQFYVKGLMADWSVYAGQQRVEATIKDVLDFLRAREGIEIPPDRVRSLVYGNVTNSPTPADDEQKEINRLFRNMLRVKTPKGRNQIAQKIMGYSDDRENRVFIINWLRSLENDKAGILDAPEYKVFSGLSKGGVLSQQQLYQIMDVIAKLMLRALPAQDQTVSKNTTQDRTKPKEEPSVGGSPKRKVRLNRQQMLLNFKEEWGSSARTFVTFLEDTVSRSDDEITKASAAIVNKFKGDDAEEDLEAILMALVYYAEPISHEGVDVKYSSVIEDWFVRIHLGVKAGLITAVFKLLYNLTAYDDIVALLRKHIKNKNDAADMFAALIRFNVHQMATRENA